MLPIATIASLTATGDVVTGPCCPMVLINGLPAACIGDLVAGPMCLGVITVTTSMLLLMGRPAATMGSIATGVNPTALGAPAMVPIALTVGMNTLV